MGTKASKSEAGTEHGYGVSSTSEEREMHYILDKNFLYPPFPAEMLIISFGAGCFWGTEKGFWRLPGVYSTAVGFQGGRIKDPSYRDVCSGSTGHNECTQVVFDPTRISVADLLIRFWDCHDPTQGDGQGNDRGSQYRSGIYCSTAEQVVIAKASRDAYETALKRNGKPGITTEIMGPGALGDAYPTFYYAEDYHQQYLAKPNARQYCSAEPTGIPVPPFTEWKGIDAALREKHQPLLPAEFWAGYIGSIRAPNLPAVWDPVAAKKAAEEIAALEAEFLATKTRLESDSDVIIRFCGACGFVARAEEIARFITEATAGAKKVGLLQDVKTTGNMDVSVKSPDGTWVLVHSKVTFFHGHVDSEAKKSRILDALKAASTAEIESIAVKVVKEKPIAVPVLSVPKSVDAEVKGLIASSRVLVFSKSYCPYCKSAKSQFQELGIEFTALELDQLDDGSDIQLAVTRLSGIDTVPVVYVEQKLIGDSAATKAARAAGIFDHLASKD